MPETQFIIDELKRKAACSRDAVADRLGALELSFNIPLRVRKRIMQSPLKSAGLAVASGLIASKVIPLALRLTRTSIGAQVARFALLNFVIPFAQSLASRDSLRHEL